MVKKSQQESPGEGRTAAAQLSDTVKESAQQIWLAGLGAFSKAQEEGGKVFESLVKDGVNMQRKTQAAAEDRLSEASNRMASMASELSARASGQWDKLEGIFDERVARAMSRLGMPSSTELDRLAARVEELEQQLQRLQARGAGTRAGARKTAAAAPGAKVPRKRAPARKSSA